MSDTEEPRCPACGHRWSVHVEDDGCISRYDDDGGKLVPSGPVWECPCMAESPPPTAG